MRSTSTPRATTVGEPWVRNLVGCVLLLSLHGCTSPSNGRGEEALRLEVRPLEEAAPSPSPEPAPEAPAAPRPAYESALPEGRVLSLRLAVSTQAMELLEHATTLELISLDPERRDPSALGPKELGRVALESTEQRVLVLSNLYESLATPDVGMAMCHYPRHLLRAVRGQDRVDISICFECNNVYVRSTIAGVYRQNGGPVSSTARRAFNRLLARARVPYEVDLRGKRSR